MTRLDLSLYPSNLDPKAAAQSLDDRTVIDSCLRVSKILSTALYVRNTWNNLLYKPDQENHEWVVWTAGSRNNFRWMYHYGMALCDEYVYRWKKDGYADQEHGSRFILGYAWETFRRTHKVFPSTSLTDFPNTTRYSSYIYPAEAYQKYLLQDHWTDGNRFWTRRGQPDWYETKSHNTPSRLDIRKEDRA